MTEPGGDFEPSFPQNVIPLPAAPDPPTDTSDDGLAQLFLEEHSHQLRFVSMWGRWLVWDGARWVRDDYMKASLLAHHTLRRIAKAEARILEGRFYKPKEQDRPEMRRAKRSQARREAIEAARPIKSFRTRNATLHMAMPDERVASIPDDFDTLTSQNLFNTRAGTVDIRTGAVYAHRPQDHITLIAGVDIGDVPTPRWNAFLEQITDRNVELQAYIQRMCGYFLTGDTTEQAMFFGYGTGANGKSVLLNTLASIMGGYHKTAPIETFISSSFDRHPTELAELKGARLVTSSETEQGRRWAEARLKMLTGGERVAARFMRQDFFEFTPQFKLFIIGNHKPKLRTVDEAIRRRFHLVPFTVTIPRNMRDPNLMERLRPEWPGILQWMVRGYAEWARIRLSPPQAVIKATEAYMSEEDALTTWFNTCCDRDKNAFTSTTDLFASWTEWAKQNDEAVGTVINFSDQLSSRSDALQIQKKRTMQARGFTGVGLLKQTLASGA